MNVCSDHGNLRTAQQKYLLFTNPSLPVILLMAEILHQLIGSLSHYLGFHTSQVVQDFSHQQYLLRLGLWGVLGHTFSEGMSRETFGTLHHWTPIIVYKCAYIYYIYIYTILQQSCFNSEIAPFKRSASIFEYTMNFKHHLLQAAEIDQNITCHDQIEGLLSCPQRWAPEVPWVAVVEHETTLMAEIRRG